MTDTLAQLKAEAARLNARIAELERGQPPKAPPVEERRGVSVTEVITETNTGPTLVEARKLFQIVKVHAPWPLADKYDEDRPFRSFCASFRWAQNVGRLDVPNSKVSLSFWLDHARNWLRARNAIGAEIDANAVILATLAAGDIVYQRANMAEGRLWELGLREYGGRPASADAWRTVMASGTVRSAVHSARAMQAASPVRVLGF